MGDFQMQPAGKRGAMRRHQLGIAIIQHADAELKAGIAAVQRLDQKSVIVAHGIKTAQRGEFLDAANNCWTRFR